MKRKILFAIMPIVSIMLSACGVIESSDSDIENRLDGKWHSEYTEIEREIALNLWVKVKEDLTLDASNHTYQKEVNIWFTDPIKRKFVSINETGEWCANKSYITLGRYEDGIDMTFFYEGQNSRYKDDFTKEYLNKWGEKCKLKILEGHESEIKVSNGERKIKYLRKG